MLDWEALVSERLGMLGGDQGEREEIVRELAGHLQDFYLAKCARGLSEMDAMEQALAQVADWRELTQKIRLAKREEDSMNDRTKGYWLPGLAAFTASMVWLMILQLTMPIRHPWYPTDYVVAAHASSAPRMMSNSASQIYFLAGPYLFWLLAQPVFGALGAYLSRRGGGETRARLVAGVFPSLLFLFALGVVFAMAVFLERNPYVLAHPVYFAMTTVPWVIVPGAALALGVLPFLRTSMNPAADPRELR
jgi:hypothetical protein